MTERHPRPRPAAKPVDPEEIYALAERYRAAVPVLNLQNRLPDLLFAIPVVVLRSFALELYLKCLTAIEGGAAAKTHEIRKLFDRLTRGSQDAIERVFDATVARDPFFAEVSRDLGADVSFAIRDVLDEVNTNFEDWRYAYEGNAEGSSALRELIEAVRARIRELRPAYRPIGPAGVGPL